MTNADDYWRIINTNTERFSVSSLKGVEKVYRLHPRMFIVSAVKPVAERFSRESIASRDMPHATTDIILGSLALLATLTLAGHATRSVCIQLADVICTRMLIKRLQDISPEALIAGLRGLATAQLYRLCPSRSC